jgi:hypothetical protein
MSELLFGFKDLINVSSQTNQSFFDLGSILFNDSYLKAISPKRYNFYVKFVSGLGNPEALEQFFYKTKDTREFKTELREKALKFNKVLKKLYENLDKDTRDNIIKCIKATLKNKYNYNDETTDKIISTLKYGGADVDEIVKTASLNTGKKPMKDFLEKLSNIAPDIEGKPINNVEDLLITKEEQEKRNEKASQSKADIIKNIKPLYNKYKEDLHPDNLKITVYDRIVFIGTTFVIRFITLMIIEWGLSTNLVNNFYNAFFYYCVIYLLFFIFITMIVNVVVHYPIMNLFSNAKIIDIPNLFYYFYIYTNGYVRLLLHIFLIIVILFIPYVINIDKIKFLRNEEKKVNITYDYEKKRQILNAISLFSFFIWVLTSIIASKF